jgi:PIN domain nuclease of toxin-antitoxin system
MKTVNLLDAHAILKYLKKEHGYETVSSLFKDAQRKKTMLIMSEINMGEVYYQLYKVENLSQSNHIWNLFLLFLYTLHS